MAQTNFKRYELKYKLTCEQYKLLLNEMPMDMQLDQYGRHKISNIYFDTDDYRIIRHSLEKPKYKSMKSPSSRDDNKTIGFFSSSIGKEPVVGWLVCTEGEHFGEDFRLKSGRNFIGRANGMDVSISKDTTVSRERHAIVVYEPRGNMFLMQAGDSKELCYLNEQVVLSPQTLNANDRILVGKTELMFIPCCSKDFSGEKKD